MWFVQMHKINATLEGGGDTASSKFRVAYRQFFMDMEVKGPNIRSGEGFRMFICSQSVQ